MPFRRLAPLFCLPMISTVASGQPLPPGITPELVEQARELLRSVPFTDGHNDLPSSLLDVVRGDLDDPGADLTRVQPELPADIPRLREGAVGAQFWSAYVDVSYIASGESLRQVLREIDVIHRFVERYDDFAFARTADDIERAHAEGRIASLIGIEGGHAIEGSTAALRLLYDLGARYMTLTHFATHDWADAATANTNGSAQSSPGTRRRPPGASPVGRRRTRCPAGRFATWPRTSSTSGTWRAWITSVSVPTTTTRAVPRWWKGSRT